MEKEQLDQLNQMFQQAMETNPVFKGMDSLKLNELSRDFLKSFDVFSTGGSYNFADWTNTWLNYQSDLAQVWMSGALGAGKNLEEKKDPRFKSDAWDEGVFPLLRQSYELTAKAMTDMADKAGLPDHEQNKLSFYARIAADNIAPSNFAATNPDVLNLAKETGGKSLMDGFQNLLEDLQKGYITTTDEDAFEVGKNLATTPGKVVYRNELIELIQYEPMTDKVRGNPVLVVPPCVNKFYIFDLNEKKSMVRYMLEQGQPVFMISWRNPSSDQGDNGWDVYIQDGIFEALKVTSDISKSKDVDMMSWCNGGTMLIAALSVIPDDLKALIGSATFLSSMISFEDPGQVKVFMDDQQNAAYNLRLQAEGVAPGRDIANAMAMLHVNESIWNFVISNYLMGKTPAPFDVLYWNSDTSNLPAKWYNFYIEEMYMADKLKQPGALTLLDTPVDTRNIDVPCYFVAADGDHIVPWHGSYAATSLVSGPSEFVLTTGGHVSGTVINHPTRNRKRYWTNGDTGGDAEAWQSSAAVTDGSWWAHWLAWLQKSNPAAEQAKPKTLGNRNFKAMEEAPGTYVSEAVQ